MSAMAHQDLPPYASPEALEMDLRGIIDGAAAFYAGSANVALQMGHPGVGYGVIESTVESGQVVRHPIKRARTTLTYLAVAMLGTDADRAVYKSAIDRVHAHVRSTPSSAVSYNAFDRELQLWVASCLYFGTVDTITRMHGPLEDQTADALLAQGSYFATTLQVPPEMWHRDREAFAAYWQEKVEAISFDPPVRDYLVALLRFDMFPWWLYPAGRFLSFMNTGFLPEPLKEQLEVRWTRRDEALFTGVVKTTGLVLRLMPRPVRNFPFNFCLWDVRRRSRTGAALL